MLFRSISSQYKDLVEKSTIFAKLDINGVFIYVNEEFCNLVGYDCDELIGSSYFNLIDIEDLESFRINVRDVVLNNKAWKGHVVGRRKDGLKFLVQLIAKPLSDLSGKIMEIFITATNKTDEELKKLKLESDLVLMEEVTKENRYLLEQYQTAIDKSLLFAKLDLSRNFTYANLEFCKLLNMKFTALKGANFYEIFDILNNRSTKELGKLGRTSMIIKYTNKHSEVYYISAQIFFVYDLNRNPVEIVVIGTDVTEIYRAKQEMKDVQRDIILTMGSICEGKSRETGNHVKRVAEFSALLARLYGCSEEEIELLRMTAPMHDIGKLTVPENILNKPAKLTPEEFEIVKKHSYSGYELLHVSERDILKTASVIALTHHEWWNGNG